MRTDSERKSYGDYLLTSAFFFVFGGLIGAATYVAFIPPNLRLVLKVAVALASLGTWLAASRIESFAPYRGLARSFFSIAIGVLLSQYITRFLPPSVIGSTTTIAGIGKAKFIEALPIALSILAFHFAFGGDPDGLFLKTGNLKFGALAGASGAAIFLAIAALQAIGSNLAWDTIWKAMPWLLLFALSNSFLEELWFRALFLKKLEPMISTWTALVLTSFVFAVVHISSTYVIDIVQFVAVTFLLGLIWAWVMRRANSIWPAVMIHASGDVLILLGFLAAAP